MRPDELLSATGVSRETLARLERYADLLRAWTGVSLVGPATLPDLWHRHFLDSAQLAPLLPDGPITDLGSGAGFPGLVLAIMTGRPVTLVENDGRKVTFLRQVIEATDAPAAIDRRSIEALPDGSATILTARALAPLDKLCEHAARLLAPGGLALFMKGARWEEELTIARRRWTIPMTAIPSITNPTSIIFRVERPTYAGQP